MSGKSKMNIIFPFLHMQVPLTKAYSATYNPKPNKIHISENREKKRNIGELSKLDYNQTNNIRKLIKENGMDENILKMAKSQLESLEEKKKQKSLLLKLNGGIENKPELVEEICDLMIDSIQARLSIIKEIENLDDQNNVDNNDMNQNEEQNENQEK